MKLTVPVGVPADEVTTEVNVTAVPNAAGLGAALSEVALAARLMVSV